MIESKYLGLHVYLFCISYSGKKSGRLLLIRYIIRREKFVLYLWTYFGFSEYSAYFSYFRIPILYNYLEKIIIAHFTSRDFFVTENIKSFDNLFEILRPVVYLSWWSLFNNYFGNLAGH